MSTQTIQLWELDWTFGDRVRKARRVLGISTDELARTLGVSKQAVSQWETGATTPRSVNAIARRMTMAYGIPTEWLLGQAMPPTTGSDPDGGGEWAHWGSNPEPTGSLSGLVVPLTTTSRPMLLDTDRRAA